MTAKATARQAPPTPDTPDEDELRRYSPEEVIEKKWLPYASPRVLRQKVYRHEVTGHTDGGRVTFTAEDLREESARKQRPPVCSRCKRAVKKTAA